jgi:cation transport regulator ChaC
MMFKEEIWYFAYGSNLNIGQMINRVGEFTGVKKANLKEYKLVFNVNSKRWGGLAANLRYTGNPEDETPGVIYRLIKEKISVLNIYEGVEPSDITVEAEGQKITAKVYLFNSSRPSGQPPTSYLNVITEGLRQHGYPETVIEETKEIAKG